MAAGAPRAVSKAIQAVSPRENAQAGLVTIPAGSTLVVDNATVQKGHPVGKMRFRVKNLRKAGLKIVTIDQAHITDADVAILGLAAAGGFLYYQSVTGGLNSLPPAVGDFGLGGALLGWHKAKWQAKKAKASQPPNLGALDLGLAAAGAGTAAILTLPELAPLLALAAL